MRRKYAQPGMTLVEILVVLATVAVLAGALLGIGRHIVVRGKEDLTQSAIEVLVTALEQYYTDLEAFPLLYHDDNGNGVYDNPPDSLVYNEADLEGSLAVLTGIGAGGYINPSGSINTLGAEAVSGTALFYYLNQNSNSRKIIDALTTSLISNKAVDETTNIIFTDGLGKTIDLPRFVDAWGVSIRYEYLPDAAFPVLTSAGPDGKFDTTDDITSK